MKKNFFSFLLVILLLATLTLPALAEAPDAFSSASVADFYGDAGLTGDDLMNAINSFSGFYLVTTPNPDGTANSGFFIYACKAHEGKYYLQLGLAENQTRQNLLANGEGLAIYAANPSSDEGAKPYAVAGARMWLTQVTDEAVLAALNTDNSETALFFEITEIRSLG